MDAAGAAKLRWRIEQQQHWRQAQAVLDGRQPSVDPDMEALVSVGDGIRIYAERNTSEGPLRMCKRLVDGVWWLAYRMRRPLGEGRGFANVVARSDDGVRFEPVVGLGREAFGAESLERPALVHTPDGRWRLAVDSSSPNP